MLATTVLLFALAAVGLADVPAGYKTVYLTSKVDAKLAIVPKTAAAGSIIQVFVLYSQIFSDLNAYINGIIVRLSPALQPNNGISKKATAQSNWPAPHYVWMVVQKVRVTCNFSVSNPNISIQQIGKIWEASL